MLTAAALALVLNPPALAGVTLSAPIKVQGMDPLAFAAAPSGSRVAISLQNKDVVIFDAASRKTIRTFSGHPQPVYGIAWSKDGTFLATGDASARIFIWNALTGEKMKTMIGHVRGIQNLSFNSSRTLLASTGNDDLINVWSVPSGKKTGEIKGEGLNVFSANFSPRVDTLLVGTLTGVGGARTYRVGGSGCHVMDFLTFSNPSGQRHGVADCSWSPDGTKAVTAGNDGLAVLWDLKTFKKLGVFRGHTDELSHARFSPNGRLVATSSTDRSVRLWDTSTFKQVAMIENESDPICFTSDGKYLLTVGQDDHLEIYALSPSQGGSGGGSSAPKRRRRHGG